MLLTVSVAAALVAGGAAAALIWYSWRQTSAPPRPTAPARTVDPLGGSLSAAILADGATATTSDDCAPADAGGSDCSASSSD